MVFIEILFAKFKANPTICLEELRKPANILTIAGLRTKRQNI